MEAHRIGIGSASAGAARGPDASPREGRRGRRDVASLLALAVLVSGTAVFLSQAGSVEGVYLAVHVVSVSAWVGGAVMLLIVALLTERSRDPQAMANLMRHMTRIGERIFTPASLLALASGIALVQTQGGGYGRFWIDFGLVVWAFSFVTGAAFIGPTSKKLTTLIPERGLADPGTARRLTGPLRIARFDAAMLVLVVVDMAAQPVF